MINKSYMILLLSFISMCLVYCKENEEIVVNYPDPVYPGRKTEVFAREVVSSENREHSTVTFSNDGKELYFTRQYKENEIDRHDILVMRYSEGEWSGPEKVSFTSDFLDDGTTFTTDGKKLFFGSRRSAAVHGKGRKDTDIWYVERTEDGFGKPVNVGFPVNSDANEGFPCLTNDNTLYFHSDRGENANMDLFYSKYVNGKYTQPVRLPSRINTEYGEGAVYVSSDGSYMFFVRIKIENNSFNTDLMFSTKNNKDDWREPISLKQKLGLTGDDIIHARVSPDNKYIFILDHGDIKWITADIIQELRKESNIK